MLGMLPRSLGEAINLASHLVTSAGHLSRIGSFSLERFDSEWERVDDDEKAAFKDDLGRFLPSGPISTEPSDFAQSEYHRARQDAASIVAHTLPIYCRQVDLGREINWHRDFVSGFEFPQADRERIDDIIRTVEGADIRNVWELNRLLHLTILGEAYALTSDESVAVEFESQVSSWIRENPFGTGANWYNAMEASIRAANLILSSSFFVGSPSISEPFWVELMDTLYLHGKFVSGNLEIKLPPNNHLMADLVGLVYMGLLFKRSSFGEAWLNAGIDGLVSESRRQVLPDGVQYEASLPYHRFVTELILYSSIQLERFGIEVPLELRNRLRQMLEFMGHAIKPGGSLPVIGDSDDGRLHILRTRSPSDCGHLLAIGAVHLREPGLRQVSQAPRGEVLWLYGEEGLKALNGLVEPPHDPGYGLAHRDSGFYILRNGPDYAIVHMPKFFRFRPRGHAHVDILSFELTMNAVDFIVDPGVKSYTSSLEERNLFRGGAYHNTVTVDGEEFCGLNRTSFFSRIPPYKSGQPVLNVGSGGVTVQGSVYRTFPNNESIRHTRSISYEPTSRVFMIRDDLEAKKTHAYDAYLHADVGTVAGIDGSNIVLEARGETLRLSCDSPANLELTLLDGLVAPCYSTAATAPILKIHWGSSGHSRLEMRAQLADRAR